MTNPIGNDSAWSGGTSATTSGTSATGATSNTGQELDREAFLKLLIAQLKYQDPSKPVDSSQFVTQTAQFTMVDKLNSIESSHKQLLLSQVALQANSLIGRTISYTNDQGASASGVVTSASFSGSSPTVKVGNTDVPLSSVTEVRTAAG